MCNVFWRIPATSSLPLTQKSKKESKFYRAEVRLFLVEGFKNFIKEIVSAKPARLTNCFVHTFDLLEISTFNNTFNTLISSGNNWVRRFFFRRIFLNQAIGVFRISRATTKWLSDPLLVKWRFSISLVVTLAEFAGVGPRVSLIASFTMPI